MAHVIYKSPVKSVVEQRNVFFLTLLLLVALLFYVTYLLPSIVSTIDSTIEIMRITF